MFFRYLPLIFSLAPVRGRRRTRRGCRRPCSWPHGWPRAVPGASAALPHVSWPRAARLLTRPLTPVTLAYPQAPQNPGNSPPHGPCRYDKEAAKLTDRARLSTSGCLLPELYSSAFADLVSTDSDTHCPFLVLRDECILALPPPPSRSMRKGHDACSPRRRRPRRGR